MFSTLEEARRFIEKQDVQVIDFKFTDLWGRWHHLTIPADRLTPVLMEEGVGFDGSALGLKSVKAGDMVLVPDLSTGFLDPFWEVTTLSFICTTLEADTKKVFANDPRNIVRQAETYLRRTGVADESRWGPEFEFYVFDRVEYEYGMNRCGYVIESREADWGGNYGHAHAVPPHGGYHTVPPKDTLYNLRTEMTHRLREMGVPVKYHHHEVGGAGQCEIEIPMMGPVEAGDAAMKVKYVVKMVACAHGLTATFMPKPLYGEAGNGMHFHQHLFKDDRNLFYDPEGYGLLSPMALSYVGGLLEHGPALLAWTNPSTNSFRRLVPGYEAPVNTFFSVGNRSAAVRIPRYATRPETVRIEFRPPDGTCNVYLAMAAQLMAGLDGIRRGIDPTEAGFGPIDADIFSWSEEQRATIRPLPTSPETALEALSVDRAFLLAGEVFSDDLIEHWIAHKREEVREVRLRPHPYEMRLYYDA